jgi:GT2 family glycosyltransferase
MSTSQKKQSVSIVVNTFNRETYLKRLLESLRHLDYGNFEVVVVNGPSTDATSELLSKWETEIKVGHCSKANLSVSRNIGIAMAAGEFVAFIDDDAVPEPEWLSQALDAFVNDDIAAVGGPVFDHTGYDFQSRYVKSTRLGNSTWLVDRPSPYNCFPFSFEFPYLAGCNAIFRRSALLEIGGFDEEYEYYLDETDVCVRLIDEGYVIKQIPNSFVHHKYAPSQIREHKISKYRYPILKNKVYFSNRYGHQYYSQNEIDDEYKSFVDEHRNEIVWAISLGLLTETDLQNFEEHVTEAFIQGKRALEMPRKLITDKLMESNVLPFKHYQVIECVQSPLTIVFLCANSTSDSEEVDGCIATNKAVDLAALGHKVHLITCGDEHNTVDFEDGVWVHRIVPDECDKSHKAIEFNISQNAWNQSEVFLRELDRISSYRRIDVVQAPITNMVGFAAISSERYDVITSITKTNNCTFRKGGDSLSEGFDESTIPILSYILNNSCGVLFEDDEAVREFESIIKIGNSSDKYVVSTSSLQEKLNFYLGSIKTKINPH